MPTPKLNIVDTDEDVPRSGRAGLEIPPVLLEAAKDSLANNKTKQLTVSVDQQKEIESLLRSLQNRHGYQMTRGTRDGKRAGTKEILFTVTEWIDPDDLREQKRRKTHETASEQQEG